MIHKNRLIAVSVLTAMTTMLGSLVYASSHREAPLIAGDPRADATDLYAFVSPDKPNTVTLIANYLPFQEPAGGPNFYTFDDNVLYEIKVDSTGSAKENVTYQFRFTTNYANPNSFLYNGGPVTSLSDPDLNVSQTYTLTRIKNGQTTVLGTGLPVGPPNIGPKSTPNYAALSNAAIQTLPGGTTVFAGQVDDPFFAELGGIFDLVNIRKLPGNAGSGVDGLAGYNVNTLALQVPMTDLTSDGSQPTDPKNPISVIGVWTNASRQATRVLNTDGTRTHSGNWVQISRLGSPLVNEVVIPVGKKDLFNSSQPANDAQFANYVTNPELGGILKSLFNVKVPPQDVFGSTNQRDDLIAIFLTGIPGLTKTQMGVPAEELRLNMAIPPSANPNRLGVLGGDNQGYPNGRRLADDVVDISLQAVAGAAYPLFHPGFTPDTLASQLGDGVDANDVPFRNSFPYLAVANGGYDSHPHFGQMLLQKVSGLISAVTALVSRLIK